jgi:parallel beta-helix repeat protein
MPTHVVDLYERGDFSRVGAAIKAAQAGDRILVQPGLYREGLIIDKVVEVIGEGPAGAVTIEARGADAVLFTAGSGRVANLTLRQVGGEGRWFGVDISAGRLLLERCDITSESLACVAIHGGVDPVLRGNRIHDGKQSGVYVCEGGRGTLEDNDITGNALSGVAIQAGANPTLRGNRIHDGKGSGVDVYEGGRGTLEDNDIAGNGLAGVEITTRGNPALRHNAVHGNGWSGIYVGNGGLGMLEDNDITGNPRMNVEIVAGGNPTLRGNRICGGKRGGEAAPTIRYRGARVSAAGVPVAAGRTVTLGGSQIRDEAGAGICVSDDGLGMLEDNDITAGDRAGVWITAGGNPTLRGNRIHDGKRSGVYVYDGGLGLLEDNDITGNGLAGVEIRSSGNPTLRGNRINRNARHAVWIYNDGEGVFEDNDLTDNARGAWSIAPGSARNVTRARNRELTSDT